MHWITDYLTQWPTFICWWFCNCEANRHEIWVRFHLNPSNFNRKLTMMFKLDLKKWRLPHLKPRCRVALCKKSIYFAQKMNICMHFMNHQKSYKLDKGIMLIFVPEKKGPVLLAKGVTLTRTDIYIVVLTRTNILIAVLTRTNIFIVALTRKHILIWALTRTNILIAVLTMADILFVVLTRIDFLIVAMTRTDILIVALTDEDRHP